MKPLTPRQAAFAQAYARHGVAERAALEAGYSERTARGGAHRLLANVGIAAEVARLAQASRTATIADLIERKTWWTTLMRDGDADMKDRLRASELLGRADGDFIERRELTGPGGTELPAPTIIINPVAPRRD